MTDDVKTERDIAIHRDVYALGVALFDGAQRVAMSEAIDIMQKQGNDWSLVPQSIAVVVEMGISAAVARKLPYLNTRKNKQVLVVLDGIKGELRLSTFGAMVVKKMGDRIRQRIVN